MRRPGLRVRRRDRGGPAPHPCGGGPARGRPGHGVGGGGPAAVVRAVRQPTSGLRPGHGRRHPYRLPAPRRTARTRGVRSRRPPRPDRDRRPVRAGRRRRGLATVPAGPRPRARGAALPQTALGVLRAHQHPAGRRARRRPTGAGRCVVAPHRPRPTGRAPPLRGRGRTHRPAPLPDRPRQPRHPTPRPRRRGPLLGHRAPWCPPRGALRPVRQSRRPRRPPTGPDPRRHPEPPGRPVRRTALRRARPQARPGRVHIPAHRLHSTACGRSDHSDHSGRRRVHRCTGPVAHPHGVRSRYPRARRRGSAGASWNASTPDTVTPALAPPPVQGEIGATGLAEALTTPYDTEATDLSEAPTVRNDGAPTSFRSSGLESAISGAADLEETPTIRNALRTTQYRAPVPTPAAMPVSAQAQAPDPALDPTPDPVLAPTLDSHPAPARAADPALGPVPDARPAPAPATGPVQMPAPPSTPVPTTQTVPQPKPAPTSEPVPGPDLASGSPPRPHPAPASTVSPVPASIPTPAAAPAPASTLQATPQPDSAPAPTPGPTPSPAPAQWLAPPAAPRFRLESGAPEPEIAEVGDMGVPQRPAARSPATVPAPGPCPAVQPVCSRWTREWMVDRVCGFSPCRGPRPARCRRSGGSRRSGSGCAGRSASSTTPWPVPSRG